MSRLATVLLVAAIAASPGCRRRGAQQLTGIEGRIAQEGNAFGRYSPQDQQLIRSGRVRAGLDERAMWIAHGAPAFFWQSNIGGKWCRVFAYGVGVSDAVDTAVYSCGGMVRYVSAVQPQIPCWRVSEAGRRAVERAAYFDNLGIDRQWALLAGILQRGQTTQDIYIAFGAPYNTGSEAREDGTNAAQQVFLDRSSDAYSLYVTFVSEQVVAWRFPPERTLTPEAQQRRLDAMENRLMDQLQQMEADSIRQHQEQMAMLGDMQANQESMMDQLATQAAAQISIEMPGMGMPPGPAMPGAGGGAQGGVGGPPPGGGAAPPQGGGGPPPGGGGGVSQGGGRALPAANQHIAIGATCTDCRDDAYLNANLPSVCVRSTAPSCPERGNMCVQFVGARTGHCTRWCDDQRAPCPNGYRCSNIEERRTSVCVSNGNSWPRAR